MNTIIKYLSPLLIISMMVSCDTKKMTQTSDRHFIGKWELKGHGMMDGLLIKIDENDKKDLIGKVYKLNDNKYVRMLLDSNSVIVSSIERRSTFQFMFHENKLGSELFGLYGLDTKIIYQAQFLNNDTIVLSKDQSVTNIDSSPIRLVRKK